MTPRDPMPTVKSTISDTIFCSQRFVAAWCRHFEQHLEPLEIPVSDAEPVFAVARVGRSGLYGVDFGPSGFFASPGWDCEFDPLVIAGVLPHLQTRRIRRFEWNVRHDHELLAAALESLDCEATRVATQVLTLQPEHDQTFAHFNATIRNQIRRARKEGVVVSQSNCEAELASYYAIHEQVAEAKGGYEFVFPRAFLEELMQWEDECRFYVAKVDDRIVGGGLFLLDGDSVFYLHGAHDHAYSKRFPMCAVLDTAIQWAHAESVSTFNFGGSAGIPSLEKFKSFWGAEVRHGWRFAWQNPIWHRLDGAKRWIQNLARRS